MKKAGDLLNKYFNDIQKKEAEEYFEFQNSWLKFAGEKIGLNSKIKDVIDGQLIIEIDHPGVKQLILIKQKNIIRSVNNKFPELNINKIKFYFKNSKEDAVKNRVNDKIIENKTVNNIPQDTDFANLLKKMSKRSED